jgi:hypothetical protein
MRRLIQWIAAAACTAGCFAACATTSAPPAAPTVGCATAAVGAVHAAQQRGLQLVQVEPQPTGELGVLTDGTTVHLVYIAYSVAIADFLVEQGWSRTTTCKQNDGDVGVILERDAKVKKDEQPAEEARK